jgi:ribosome biogenesis GTPase
LHVRASARRPRRPLLESGELAAEEAGLVMAHYGTQLDIEALGGERAGQVFRCHLRANLEHLVTGDRVIWQAATRREEGREAIGVVTALQPRQTLLVRPDPYGKLKPVAANIDCILLVIAPFPEPSALLVDRYLVACELTGIRPVILLNKADLITPQMAPAAGGPAGPVFTAIGYEVRTISAGTGQLQDLSDLIGNADSRVRGAVGGGQIVHHQRAAARGGTKGERHLRCFQTGAAHHHHGATVPPA